MLPGFTAFTTAGPAFAVSGMETRKFLLVDESRFRMVANSSLIVAGTTGERRAADYLGGVFDDLGYDTTLQPFAVEDKYLARLDAPGGMPSDLCWQAGASPYGVLDVTVRAGVIDAGIGGSDDYPANVAGKIVLIDYPWLEDPGVLAGRAVERGAAAVVFLAEDLFAGCGRRRGAHGCQNQLRSRWWARRGRRRFGCASCWRPDSCAS